MAKGLCVRFEGEDSSFGLTKVDREKLYGRKERVVVDEEGRPCSTAWLTSDGAALVPAGGAAYLYVDEHFRAIERASLVGVDEQGQPAPLVPSTLGVAQEARVVDPSRVLDCITTSVYALAPETIGAALRAKLAAGAVVETRFNWREDYADSPAFLVQSGDAIFALVGSETGFAFVAREAPPPVDDEEAAADEDLDFAMM